MQENISSLWVNKADISQTKWDDSGSPELQSGQIRLAIEKYALTANNITYATIGEAFGYWNFFPTGDEQWGIVPVWGFAKVIESKNDDIAVGERIYGYLPMASHLIVTPKNLSDTTFVDGAEHRKGLAIVYNQYHRLGSKSGEHEDERAIYQPLFTTSFLIENFMRKADWYGAEALLITSASSKTGMALAAVAKSSSPQIKRIGLTSTSNREFVLQTGLYDDVLIYQDIETTDNDQPMVAVDFTGNGEILSNIHSHWRDNLKFSSLVGVTHIDSRSGTGELEGPEPVLFFAPTAAEALIKEIGPRKFGEQVDGQLSDFIELIGEYLLVEHLSGKDELQGAYDEMVGGKVAPQRGLMCSF